MTNGEEGRAIIEVGFDGQGNGPPPWAVLLVQNLVQNTLRFRESHESTSAKPPVRKKGSLSQNIFFRTMLDTHINPINPFRFMKHLFSSLALCLATIAGFAQCEADHTVEATSNLTFEPSMLTIEQGESVAFLNVGGNHDVNGVTNTVTQDPFGNPVDFSFDAVMATDEPVCIGTYTFDTPGTYNYDCSIYGHAAAGMVGTITVNPAPVTTTIWDIVEGSDDHTYLEAALLQQGLDGALNDTTVLTLFAPTDAAFEAAAAAYGTDIAGLLALPYLTDILLYHVTGGAVMSTDLSDGQVVTMLNEGTATVTIDMGVFINNAQVTGPDNTADNGVVHILDALIQPAPPVATTIWDIVVASEDHTYLEAALLQEGLDGALSDTTALTLFAPTDAALEATAAALGTDITGILALPNLTDILLYHVTAGAVLSTDLSDGLTVGMLNDAEATITIDENGVFVNDAQVTAPDLTADNGVVHVIDGVLLPPTDGILEAQASWTVMPNPASGEVRFAGLAAEATAVVLDLTGRQVAQLAAGNNFLSVGQMAPGTYVVAVTSNGSITTSKLVVR